MIENISKEEWFDVCRQLEDHHSVFYKVWEMGKPTFNDSIDTAAVQFDRGGDFVIFHFNPKFWENCTKYERLFVICHEALHIILNHGIRTKTAFDKQACNVALDIVVNHMLVNSFKFNREKIRNWQKLCWVDTVFKKQDGTLKLDKAGREIPTDECFEYYINQFDKLKINITKTLDLEGEKALGTVDDHDSLGESELGEVIDKLDKGLSNEEKNELKDVIEQHLPLNRNGLQAGSGTGGQWHFVPKTLIKKKKKWETVIKRWSLKYLKEGNRDCQQWARLNRRFQFLPSNLFLPSEMEVDVFAEDKKRILVHFFLDTSGSCWNLKDRFFKAAESLPKQSFEVRLFCFDTKVQETTLESRKIYGGGGTRFDIIETEIQKEKNKIQKYPEAVFVITDGYGNKVEPENPQVWYWFISNTNPKHNPAKKYAPKECNFFSLIDYK